MLDAEELAKRLRVAMDLRDPPMRQVDLAATLGVTKQAVYEWRTHGRIGKRYLMALAEATGMPLAYYLEVERGQSAETKKIWSRLGKAFAKAALIVAAVIATPQKQAEAAFNINILAPNHGQAFDLIHIVLRRFVRWLSEIARRCAFTHSAESRILSVSSC